MIGLNRTLGWQPEIWRAVCVARARGRRSWVQCQWVSSGKFMSGKFASDQLFTAVPENLIPRHFFFSLRSISVEARAVIGDCLGWTLSTTDVFSFPGHSNMVFRKTSLDMKERAGFNDRGWLCNVSRRRRRRRRRRVWSRVIHTEVFRLRSSEVRGGAQSRDCDWLLVLSPPSYEMGGSYTIME